MLSLPVYLTAAAGDGGVSHCEVTLLICEETMHLLLTGPYAACADLPPCS